MHKYHARARVANARTGRGIRGAPFLHRGPFDLQWPHLSAPTTRHDRLPAAIATIASGASLDEALATVLSAVAERVAASACAVWLVKQGDVCERCDAAASCPDRTLCLHLKASVDVGGTRHPSRVPLVVFRERAVVRGGVVRASEPNGAGALLVTARAVEAAGGDAVAVVPLKGPAGVLGLLAVLRATPLGADELDAVRGLADAAVLAVRVADLTSRNQRAEGRLEEDSESRADVEGLLHAMLYGSTEYDVIAEDLEGNVTVFSEGARTTYGYTPEEMIGRAKSDLLYAPEEIASGKVVEILNEAMRTGRCEAVVARLRKNGERFPARATFTVRRDAESDPCGFVIVERDLSAERTSAKLTETAALQVAQLQDHVHALKASYALLEADADELRRERDELRERVERAKEADELNAIRVELIRDLRRKLVATAADRDRLLARAPTPSRPASAHPLADLAAACGVSVEIVLGVSSQLTGDERTYTLTLPRGVRDRGR